MQQQTNQKKLFVGAIVIVILLITLVIGFLGKNSSKKITPGTAQSTSFQDPVSHQTIVTQNGKAPENNGTTTAAPLLVGFDKLLNYGLSIQQSNALQIAFGQYKPFASSSVQISLAVDAIQSIDPATSGDPHYRWSIKSHIVVNKKDAYRITIYYSGISAVQLHIYDSAGTAQLFDSGVIDTTSTATQKADD